MYISLVSFEKVCLATENQEVSFEFIMLFKHIQFSLSFELFTHVEINSKLLIQQKFENQNTKLKKNIRTIKIIKTALLRKC